jgi:hypothetical protein
MSRDERDLLEVLKDELAFLEKGGYGRSPREAWNQPLIFEDSPSCMNYDCKDHAEPCSSCVLFQLVPPQFRGKQIPCRHIPFTAEGDTLDSLSRFSHQFEIEEVFGKWLRTTIATIEKTREASQAEENSHAEAGGVEATGTPLNQKLHPKCANPACSTAFRWLEGGKFYRFKSDIASSAPENENAPTLLGIHGVEHYWLCEHCSHVFTLEFENDGSVTLKFKFPELSAAGSQKQLRAS